ncbi:MAG: transposase [Nitrosarchaeum sp.]|nr:transposase [Nitrosarchaeum sp.]
MHILEKVVRPQSQLIFNQDIWTFQQDSAPSHKAKTTQNWCQKNLPDFISTQDWPPSSPDLNPLDYFIWGVLEANVNASRHKSLESLKAKLLEEWDKLDMSMIRTAIDAWKKRLRLVVKRKGGRFE